MAVVELHLMMIPDIQAKEMLGDICANKERNKENFLRKTGSRKKVKDKAMIVVKEG